MRPKNQGFLKKALGCLFTS